MASKELGMTIYDDTGDRAYKCLLAAYGSRIRYIIHEKPSSIGGVTVYNFLMGLKDETQYEVRVFETVTGFQYMARMI